MERIGFAWSPVMKPSLSVSTCSNRAPYCASSSGGILLIGGMRALLEPDEVRGGVEVVGGGVDDGGGAPGFAADVGALCTLGAVEGALGNDGIAEEEEEEGEKTEARRVAGRVSGNS